MAKMTDVAKKAGVSVATVSRVLTGKDNILDETRKKVLLAVEELNYRPNKLARNLRKLESKTIVAVVPDISNIFFSDIIRGIETVAQQNGYYVLLGNTHNDIQSEIDYIEMVKEKLADGVILLTARIPKEEIISISQELPVVLACEYVDGADIPTVTIDNISSARKVVNHLVALGHQRIGFISGPLNVILSRDRLKGYRQALLAHDIPVDESLIQEGDFRIESGYQMASRLLALSQPPTAIFAANDEMAIGAIQSIKEKGFQVPQDIAVVGFDNIRITTIVEPALTTVNQPKFAIGCKAMEILLKIMNNEPIERKQIVLDDELVIRQSCGASS
ncbi:LacI family DNA-binding transcriptional regulator [Brevibacillus sp. SYSU BS000544]|uniref:LacI family DNA-binding transcriptional regulator n=1 Tax=Brevibacillus sp. SYSU BS000544 TaxID=3416443 RepID=UPI003CE4F6C5